jgi:maltodextrin utilization protein YvdJ
MTVNELRNHKEYKICMDKIKSYKKGFEFTLNYSEIPTAKANALKIIMADAVEQGLVESTATHLSLTGETTAETFKKL